MSSHDFNKCSSSVTYVSSGGDNRDRSGSIVGNYADGYEVGKQNGRDD
jgi:hypothetical protein